MQPSYFNQQGGATRSSRKNCLVKVQQDSAARKQWPTGPELQTRKVKLSAQNSTLQRLTLQAHRVTESPEERSPTTQAASAAVWGSRNTTVRSANEKVVVGISLFGVKWWYLLEQQGRHRLQVQSPTTIKPNP
eukprot:6458698-Amphidinium_carterae.2